MDKKKQFKAILDRYNILEKDRDFIVSLIDNNNDAEDLIKMPTKVAMAAFAIISPLLGVEGNNIISKDDLDYIYDRYNKGLVTYVLIGQTNSCPIYYMEQLNKYYFVHFILPDSANPGNAIYGVVTCKPTDDYDETGNYVCAVIDK